MCDTSGPISGSAGNATVEAKSCFFTFYRIIPSRLFLLRSDLLLNLCLLVELVEVVDDDGDGQGDAEHPADGAR